MNTKEINDSAWPLKYYAISATSLTAITLFVPLLGLQAFSTTAKLLGSSALLRRTIKWNWIILTFILNLIADILLSTNEGNSYISSFNLAVTCICYIIGCYYFVQLYMVIRTVSSQKQSLLNLWKKEGNKILFYAFTASCFLLSWHLQMFVELTPYVFYFIRRLYAVLKKRYGHKRYRR